MIGDHSPATRRAAAQVVIDLLNYRELFTADRLPGGLRPWKGASASAVAEMRSGREENKTPPVPGPVLQPLLAAALYAVTTLGPHAVQLAAELRQTATMRSRARQRPGERAAQKNPLTHLPPVLDRHRRDHDPLPELTSFLVRRRLASGWDRGDPLLTVNLDGLAREAGYWRFDFRWLPGLRPQIEAALAQAGVAKPFSRDAGTVPRAGGQDAVPWTIPLHRDEAEGLVGIVRTAAIIVILAVSGMRSSEVMELQAGSRQPPQELGPGLVRYRLAGKVIKGQPLGGTQDQWVVTEPVYRAVELAEQLHDDPRDGAPLLGRFAFRVRYQWFRDWVNGPSGQRLGLAAIPGDLVTPRMLRRTLAIELAYRPGGLLAAKLHLKHISVATTEGYASRPGGAQAEFLAEVNKHEADRNLDLVLGGVPELPAGHHARRARSTRADRVLRPHRRRTRSRDRRSAQDPAQRPRDPQPAGQTRQHPAPGHGELLLVHRPVPGAMPQTRRHPRRGQAPDRDVRLGPLPAGDPPSLPPARLGRRRRRPPRPSWTASAPPARPKKPACKPTTPARNACSPRSTPRPAATEDQ